MRLDMRLDTYISHKFILLHVCSKICIYSLGSTGVGNRVVSAVAEGLVPAIETSNKAVYICCNGIHSLEPVYH
jgi:hypothetical protein